MNGFWALIRKEKKYLLAATIVILVIFVVALIQNIIRYGIHESYNPWRSVIYLMASLLPVVPVLPLIIWICRNHLLQSRKHYWLMTTMLTLITIMVLYAFSSILIYLMSFYNEYFAIRYARQYFGREALYHVFVILGTALYAYVIYRNDPKKLVSGMLGRKKITIEAQQIGWIEADDHYLKIYMEASTLIKRSTLEEMARQLKPDFIRIHRKYLVNKQLIVGKERKNRDEFVILQSGERLKVGRSYSPLEI